MDIILHVDKFNKEMSIIFFTSGNYVNVWLPTLTWLKLTIEIQSELAIRQKLVSTKDSFFIAIFFLFASLVLLENYILVNINIPLWRVFMLLRSLLLRVPIEFLYDIILRLPSILNELRCREKLKKVRKLAKLKKS